MDHLNLYNSPDGHTAMMAWYARGLAQAPVPYESITVPTRFGDSHLLAAGSADAPPVILLHGMEGNALSWRYQMDELRADFRLYALDIIGSAGKSTPVRLSHQGHDYARWLEDILAGLRLDRASFVGMSNGSWLIMKLATYRPHVIDRAVLMSANGLMPVRFPYRLARLLESSRVRTVRNVVTDKMLTREMARLAVVFATPRGTPVDPMEVEWFYLLAKHYQYRFPPAPLADDELRALTSPTYLLMGERERFFVPDQVIARARRVLPNLHGAMIVPNVGHNMATDAPHEINRRLRALLASQQV